MKTSLHDWQKKALEAWLRHEQRGIIVAPTGVGKTVLGIASVEVSRSMSRKAVVAVHTEALMRQWHQALQEELAVEIGMLGAGELPTGEAVVVGIINTLREYDLTGYEALVLDECHHFVSEENFAIFRHNWKSILGLTSTLERADGKHYLYDDMRIQVVHTVTHDEAMSQGLLSSYRIVNVAVQLTPLEAQNYQVANDYINQHMSTYNYDIHQVTAMLQHDHVAVKLMRQIQERKGIIGNAANKVRAAMQIVTEEYALDRENLRCIVFSEFIEIAEALAQQLRETGHRVGIYHSAKKKKERQEMLEKFRTGTYQILVSCKALEEGLNVPAASVGIIIGGTSEKRQMVQRIGRILRYIPGKVATLYQIYVENTKEVQWVRKRSELLHENAQQTLYQYWRG